jgi:hypothetical protein
MSEPNCEIKMRCLAEHQKAAEVYSQVVAKFSHQLRSLTQKLSSKKEHARQCAHEARNTLEAHTYEDQC